MDERRRAVVEVAARLLASEGPAGLSLRRVAAEAGGSTQLVYTLFGGKPGLADALYAEGFRRLAGRMREEADTAEPGPERLVALGRGYRAFALAEPAFFAVMFGQAVPGFTPQADTRAQGHDATLGQVVATVEHCLATGALVAPDARSLARQCWVTAHGLASLAVAGFLPDAAPFVDQVLRGPVDAHRPGVGRPA